MGAVSTSTWRNWTARQLRGIIAALLVSLVGAGVSAQAGLAVYEQARRAAAPALPVPQGYEADPHFPGAALLLAAEDDAAPSSGTTGTITLPDLPVPAQGALDRGLDGTIRPAQPFRLRGTALDRERALTCLATAIYYEAATEPDAGQQAVAQVILNRVRHPAFPATVCGVVYQGSERRGCQFSFACDGAMARLPSRAAFVRAWTVARAALDGRVFAPVGLATHYHTYAVTPSWNRSLVMTGVWGAHFFHRWKGYWGTAAAFAQAHAGAEPIPGPHRPVTPVLASTTVFAPPPPLAPASPPVQLQPARADSGTPQPRYAETALPESTILDRWKDSGRPIR